MGTSGNRTISQNKKRKTSDANEDLDSHSNNTTLKQNQRAVTTITGKQHSSKRKKKPQLGEGDGGEDLDLSNIEDEGPENIKRKNKSVDTTNRQMIVRQQNILEKKLKLKKRENKIERTEEKTLSEITDEDNN